MDYSKMSDQEINRLVARQFPETYLFNEEGNPYQLIPDSMAVYSGIDFDEVEFQPCGNPADAWPIIADKKICLAFDVFAEPQDGGGWVASPAYGWETERARHDNPLRAAMIVFLKMQDSNNVPANPAGPDIR